MSVPRASRVAAVLASVAAASASCATNSQQLVIRPPSSRSTATATSASSASATPTASAPGVTVQPATGLTDGQQVLVTIRGFTPGLTLIVVECADKGKATGPADCNLADSATIVAGTDGTGQTGLSVRQGPFGANNVRCSAAQACLVSVNQPIPSPQEQASHAITFR